MTKQLATACFIALLSSGLLTASYLLPFNPVLLTFAPLTTLFPKLAETGSAVEYGFAWLVIKEQWVWFAVFAYYFAIAFVVAEIALIIRELDRREVSERENNSPPAH